MSCPSSADLSGVLNGNLPPDRFDAILSHVDGCTICQDAVRKLGQSTSLLAVGGPQGPAQSFADEEMCRRALGEIEALNDVGETANISFDVSSKHPDSSPSPDAPTAIDGYEIGPLLGEGGMGKVYQARDLRLNRPAAIKVICARSTTEHFKRFDKEAKAIARLRHPNIVQVFELGEHMGQPYLALEFIDGHCLSEFLHGTPLEPKQAAELCATLAEAVHYAHQQGIVHRDLKPANIMMTGGDSSARPATDEPPDISELVPSITDFGLARHLDDDQEQTRVGTILGTVKYMSPEQAEGRVRDVGPASDTYSLGAILYELLTGRAPLVGASTVETLRMVSQTEPTPPASLMPRLPIDLSTICVKCLSKDPGQRYAWTGELADDLRRFLAGEPINARPLSCAERFIKLVLRHPTISALLLAVFLITVAGIGGILWQYGEAVVARQQAEANERTATQREGEARLRQQEAEAARSRAVTAEERARVEAEATRTQLYFNQIVVAEHHLRRGDKVAARRVLAQCAVDLRHVEWEVLAELCRDTSVTLTSAAKVTSLAVTDDGRTVATGLEDGTIQFHELNTSRTAALDAPVNSPNSSPHGPITSSHYSSRDSDGREEMQPTGASPERGTVRSRLAAHDGPVLEMDFDESGARLITYGQDRVVKVWDLNAEAAIFSRSVIPATEYTYAGYSAIALTDDGTCAAFSTNESQAIVVSLPGVNGASGLGSTEEQAVSTSADLVTIAADEIVLDRHTAGITGIAFSPKGETLATIAWDKTAIVWNIESREPRHIIPIQGGGTLRYRRRVAFTSDGRTLVTASNTIDKWNLDEAQPQRQVLSQSARVTALCLSADDRRYFTHGAHGLLREGDLQTGAALRFHSQVARFAFSRNGHTLVTDTANRMGTAVYDSRVVPTRHEIEGAIEDHNPDQHRLLEIVDKSIRILDEQDRTVGILDHPDGETVYRAVLSPDGGQVAFCSKLADRVYVWQQQRQALEHTIPVSYFVRSMQFDSSGSLLLVTSRDVCAVWNLEAEPAELLWELQGPHAATFSPQGNLIATSQRVAPADTKLRNARTGKTTRQLQGLPTVVKAMVFSRNGKFLVGSSSRGDASLAVWDCESGVLLHTLTGQRGGIESVALSPDCRRIASISTDESIRIWDFESGQSIVDLPMGLSIPTHVEFTANSRAIVSTHRDRLIFRGDRRKLLRPGQSVDLLAMIDPEKHAVDSTWQSVEGRLLHVNNGTLSEIEVPVEPAGDYRLTLRMVRLTPDRVGGIGIRLPFYGYPAEFMIDAERDDRFLTGLYYANGVGLKDQDHARRGDILKQHQERLLEVRVTHRGEEVTVVASVDEGEIYRYSCPITGLGVLRPRERLPANPNHLAIFANCMGIEIREAKLEMLSGVAKVAPGE